MRPTHIQKQPGEALCGVNGSNHRTIDYTLDPGEATCRDCIAIHQYTPIVERMRSALAENGPMMTADLAAAAGVTCREISLAARSRAGCSVRVVRVGGGKRKTRYELIDSDQGAAVLTQKDRDRLNEHRARLLVERGLCPPRIAG